MLRIRRQSTESNRRGVTPRTVGSTRAKSSDTATRGASKIGRAIVRRLARDRFNDKILRHPALAALLHAIPAAAFVVDARGAIACTNAWGRAVLRAGGHKARAALARAVLQRAGGPSFVVRTIGVRGARLRYLVVMTNADAQQARARVMAARWGLTGRQAEVLTQVAQGTCNKDISARLGCAEVTVEFHVTALLRKANVESRTALVARFWSGG